MNLSRSPERNWSMWTVLGLSWQEHHILIEQSEFTSSRVWRESPHGSEILSLFSLRSPCCLWSVTRVHCEVFSIADLKTLLLMSVMNVIISSSRIITVIIQNPLRCWLLLWISSILCLQPPALVECCGYLWLPAPVTYHCIWSVSFFRLWAIERQRLSFLQIC